MRILLIHNHYQQAGGEDAVFRSEVELLRSHGHEVELYERSNHEITASSLAEKVRDLVFMHFSKKSYDDARRIICKFRPDIVHVFNTFFMITPSIYDACCDEGVPVVQSLYNYRLFCANALLLRNGKHCENCLTKSKWWSVYHRCYRRSMILTALVAKMINYHNRKRTWSQKIAHFIVATEFSKRKFIEAGISPNRISVRPHFIDPDPGMRTSDDGHALFVGRLSAEKGILILLEAWRFMNGKPLKIIGSGPLRNEVEKFVELNRLSNVKILGYVSELERIECLKSARFVIIPSISHDNFPRTIPEAYACGVPVLASRLEGIREYVDEGATGQLFEVGNVTQLVSLAQQFFDLDSSKGLQMGRLARLKYETHYARENAYQSLLEVYESAVKTIQCGFGGKSKGV